MADYHEASKIVKPKLEALRGSRGKITRCERELFKAESRLKACQEVLGNLQRDFDAQLATKRKIEENAMRTRKRMEQATSLIDGLAGERIRWTNDSDEFKDIKSEQACGRCGSSLCFVAYCGPFNQDFS